jgi:hypothetical protein
MAPFEDEQMMLQCAKIDGKEIVIIQQGRRLALIPTGPTSFVARFYVGMQLQSTLCRTQV